MPLSTIEDALRALEDSPRYTDPANAPQNATQNLGSLLSKETDNEGMCAPQNIGARDREARTMTDKYMNPEHPGWGRKSIASQFYLNRGRCPPPPAHAGGPRGTRQMPAPLPPRVKSRSTSIKAKPYGCCATLRSLDPGSATRDSRNGQRCMATLVPWGYRIRKQARPSAGLRRCQRRAPWQTYVQERSRGPSEAASAAASPTRITYSREGKSRFVSGEPAPGSNWSSRKPAWRSARRPRNAPESPKGF